MNKLSKWVILVLPFVLLPGCAKKPQTMSDRDHGLVIKKFEKQLPLRIAGPLKGIATNIEEYSDAQLTEKFGKIRTDARELLKEACDQYEFTVEMLDKTHKQATGRTYTEEVNAKLGELFDRIRNGDPYEDLVWGKGEEPKGSSQDITYLAKASASSALSPGKYGDYEAKNVLDGVRSTCWADGVEGSGIGEWVKLTFPREVTVTRVGIVPG